MDRKTPEQVAQETLSKINKDKEDKRILDEKKKAEASGAAAASSTEKPKTEEEKIRILADAEAQSKKDEELLSKKDEDLTQEEKTRKVELLTKKSEHKTEKELNEDKVNKRKAEIQAEIDRLISRKKKLEEEAQQSEKMKQDIEKMKAEVEALKREKSRIDAEKNIPEEQKVLKKKEEERLAKYLEEDKALPKEQRREMTKDELEEWLLEDNLSAQEWMVERSLRRSRERFVDINEQKKDKFVKDFRAKQEESNLRVLAKYPELDTTDREQELKSQGKSEEEVHKILCAENEKYRITTEIFKENPELYLTKENGPELVVEEMEKKISTPKNKEVDSSEIERLKNELAEKEAEISRLKGVDETLGSTRPKDKPAAEEKKTEFQLKQEALAKKAGISPEKLKKAIARRANIAGVSA